MSRQTRVLHVTVHETGGGTEKMVRSLKRVLPGHSMLALETILGLPFAMGRVPAAIRAMRTRKPDVVFCYGIRSHVMAVLAWPIGGPVLVGNMRGERDFAGRREWLRQLIRPRFATWVGNSKRVLGNERGRVIYTGVPVPRIAEKPLLKELKRPVFGVLANERPMKGHRWLLDLWKRIEPPGTLVFAGRISDALRKDANQAGVICTGYVPAAGLLRSLDLLLIPSDSESIPRVIFEAMAREVPVLATPAGGIEEVLRHGENGYVLPRELWGGFLPRFDPKDAAKIAKTARLECEKKYSFRVMRKAYEELVEEVRAEE